LSSVSYNWFVKKKQWRGTFLNRGRGAENIKYKFYFAAKLPNIYSINQKCSTAVEARGSGSEALSDWRFWDLLPK